MLLPVMNLFMPLYKALRYIHRIKIPTNHLQKGKNRKEATTQETALKAVRNFLITH